jgi:predicted transcriptional regulator
MDAYLVHALDIVKAQAKVRNMNEEEISAMVSKLAGTIQIMDADGAALTDANAAAARRDPKKAIKERTITCLESGKSFKILTRKHLARFGLTPEEYRAKWGYPKGLPLVCKALQRERRKKMREMKLWERRKLEL